MKLRDSKNVLSKNRSCAKNKSKEWKTKLENGKLKFLKLKRAKKKHNLN